MLALRPTEQGDDVFHAFQPVAERDGVLERDRQFRFGRCLWSSSPG